ncbi:ROK family protein [Halalkalibacter urbisdiaboli]|uniref:ROK family protein n=1 Tax=Halalkalibacter urbisdiaboli TaxID=1960589 RepID=UPI000B43466D|nr:ROK family protein [Halalkalibacter urbisdiaboli]
MSFAVGIDIGGTKIAIGVVSSWGEVVIKDTIAMNVECSPTKMIDDVLLCMNKQLHSLPNDILISGIGIGAPGPLNVEKGIILSPTNLPTWQNFAIVNQVKMACPYPVVLENDANAAALAEKLFGAGKDCDDFIYLTVSTGIGAGIISGGVLLSGFQGNAGEIGHLVVDPSAGTCKCGQAGCLYMVSSGKAIAQRGSEIVGSPVSTEDVFNLYFKGHQEITQLVEKAIWGLGVGCVSLINFIEPEKIIIGGGVSKVGEPLFSAIRSYVKNHALHLSGKQTKIIPTSLKQDSGLIGAAALVFQ